jgi:hypothetical protein
MRELLLGMLLVGAGGALAGCQPPVTNGTASRVSRARPLDNFGEILTVRKAAAAGGSAHGATGADNFGEIL